MAQRAFEEVQRMRALVFSIDDAYVMPFKVLWHSLMKTDSVPSEAPVFILHAETLSEQSIADLLNFLGRYKRTATFMDARSFVPDDVPLSNHISKATYYRLFVASILPEEISSAVYLDSDAVVIRSIRRLFDLEFTHPVAAADHMSPSNAFRLWGEQVGNYFQAGVMLADLRRWRSSQFEQTFKKILIDERERILWWDQDVLNMAFENNWQRLPVWYNLCRQARSEISEEVVMQHGRFLHLDGSGKPWKYHSTEWTAENWYQLYQDTFGKAFDKNAIQRPMWKRSASAAKRLVKCVLGRT